MPRLWKRTRRHPKQKRPGNWRVFKENSERNLTSLYYTMEPGQKNGIKKG